jgi:WhiB family transcriptional regulator, redox-sensing transcriptional regulator
MAAVEVRPMARSDAIPERTDWQEDAACRGADTSIFFPVSEADAGEAKAICAVCPVAEACLEYAIATRQPDGVWGGMTPTERHRLIRRRQKAARKARAAAAASDAAA